MPGLPSIFLGNHSCFETGQFWPLFFGCLGVGSNCGFVRSTLSFFLDLLLNHMGQSVVNYEILMHLFAGLYERDSEFSALRYTPFVPLLLNHM